MHPFLQECPGVLEILGTLVVQVFLKQKFQLGRGFQVVLVGPGVLVNQLVQYLLLVHLVLSPLVFLAVLANLASRCLVVLVALAALALLEHRDFHSLIFLVVRMDLGGLEVQRGLVDREYLALPLLLYLKDMPRIHTREPYG